MKTLFMDANQADAGGKRFAGSLMSLVTQLSGVKNLGAVDFLIYN